MASCRKKLKVGSEIDKRVSHVGENRRGLDEGRWANCCRVYSILETHWR